MPFGITTCHVLCFFIALSIGGLSLLFYSITLSNVVNTDSPSFGQQEIKNTPENWKVRSSNGDWIPAADGSSNTDILAINYFSDGQFLNATLWLNGPVGNPPNNDNDRAYGMLIDADSNNKTGWEGIDYQVEINGQNGYGIKQYSNGHQLEKHEF